MNTKIIMVAIFAALLVLTVLFVTLYRNKGSTESFATNKPTLTWYMAEWCGHCKTMKSEWEKLEQDQALKQKVDLVKVVESKETREIMSKKQIKGFPTIHFDKDGKTTEYSGPRTAVELKKFVEKNL